jgi:hypothetical protein
VFSKKQAETLNLLFSIRRQPKIFEPFEKNQEERRGEQMKTINGQ